MSELKKAMEQDITERVPSKKELDSLSKYIGQQLETEAEIENLKSQLLEKQATLQKLSTEIIPAIFLEIGLSEIKLSDGRKVQIKKFYSASINDENRDEAFMWLRKNNLGDIIKHELKVNLGKGEDAKAEKIKAQLQKLQMNYIDNETIHPQTLKAFVKEQIEAMGDEEGSKFPVKLFKVYIGNQTKIVNK